MTHPAPALATARTPRDYRIDFFRGVALLAITINHTVRPVTFDKDWKHEVGQYFGFNFADVFVFLSGLVCAFAYARVFDQQGLVATEIKALKRCGQIYIAAIVAFAATALLMLVFSGLPKHQVASLRFDFAPLKTVSGVVKALLISGPYNHFAILKFYIVLLAIMPLGFVLYRMNRWLLLGVTVAVWAGINGAVQAGAVSKDFGAGPFGNYFAWQLLFFGGLWIGCERRAGRLNVTMNATRVIALIGLQLLFQYGRQMLWIVPRLDDRPHLGPVRVVSLLAVLLIIRHVVPPQAAFFTTGVADQIRRLGTRSLTIFAASIFLCYAGTHTAAVLLDYRGATVQRAGFLVILVAELIVLMVFNRLIEGRTLRDTPAAPSQAAPSQTAHSHAAPPVVS